MKVYEMEMEFELGLGLKGINDFMHNFGFDEKLCASGNVLSIKQTIPFIPDESYLETVAQTIKKHYQNSEFEVVECKFKGYKKFLEKEIQ